MAPLPLMLTDTVDTTERFDQARAIEEAHAALDRMGAGKSPYLELRVLDLERQFRAAVPKNVWGGR